MPTNITSGYPNCSIIVSAVNFSISACKLLGNFSSQSTVKHLCPLARKAFDKHSVPLNNSNTFNSEGDTLSCTPPPGQFLRLSFCYTTERAHVINRLCFLLYFILPCTLARYLDFE